MLNKLKCFLYRIYDWSKSTWLISHLFYGGMKYQHFEDISVTGTVTSVNVGGEVDGDYTFDIVQAMLVRAEYIDDVTGRKVTVKTGGQSYHCEITPCYPITVALKVGDIVRVYGTETFDPAHLGNAAKLEIHPVKSIEILA